MILLPFGLMLTVGIFTAEPSMRILLALADISLIVVLILPFYKRTEWTTVIEVVSFFILLLPLLKIFISFSFEGFDYFLFLFPIGCFIIFFPLSIFLADKNYRKNRQKLISNLDFDQQGTSSI
jgi:hypothetical protein